MDSGNEEEEDVVESMTEKMNAFIKRRNLKREVEEGAEIEQEHQKVKQFFYRQRKWEERPPYHMSPWGRMLVHPRTKDPTDRKGGKLFRRRFRVPFPLFERITEMTRINAWFSEEKDCAGRRAAPLELKILGVLRVLGRGYCFDGIEELNFISAESNRVFFHTWCELFTKKYFSIYCNPPETDAEISSTMAVYNRLGFPGCIGSTDCVHIRWECCASGDRFLHKGKEGYPTLSYEVTVDHTSKIIAVTHGFPGTRNDQTIVRFDGFVTDIHDGIRYKDVTYPMNTITGQQFEQKGAWLLVDGGYHKWECLQCPLKHSAIPRETLWSEWAETVRKDVECTFGVLKGRFRCLKLPIYYQNKENIDNMFYVCCIMHNILLHFDGLDVRWEKDVNYLAQDGQHSYEDMVIFRQHLSRVRNLTPVTDYSLVGRLAVQDRYEIVNGSAIETEIEASYITLQRKLIDHFAWKYSRNEIQWLKAKNTTKNSRK
jgi:Plant transposon protein